MAVDPELGALRDAIDDVDRQILNLVARRVGLVLEVGDYKRARDIGVYDPSRERAVLERLCRAAPDSLEDDLVKRVFERLIDECRRVEQHHVTAKPWRSK